MIDLDDLERVANRWPDNSYVAFSAAAWKAPTGEPLVVVAATELRALVAAARGQEWQDISTAPRGKNLLLYALTDTKTGNWKMETGFLSSDGRWHWEGRWLAPYDVQPTHWRPLPAPPAESGSALPIPKGEPR